MSVDLEKQKKRNFELEKIIIQVELDRVNYAKAKRKQSI